MRNENKSFTDGKIKSWIVCYGRCYHSNWLWMSSVFFLSGLFRNVMSLSSWSILQFVITFYMIGLEPNVDLCMVSYSLSMDVVN